MVSWFRDYWYKYIGDPDIKQQNENICSELLISFYLCKVKNASILIVGAGPAGVSTSAFLSQKKIPHTIIDKARFPRDKICGDALSGKTVFVLNKIDPRIVNELKNDSAHYTGSYGICFFSPNGRRLDIPFSLNPENLKNAPGFIARRIHFDEYLYNRIDKTYATILPETELQDLVREKNKVKATLSSRTGITSEHFDLVVGAEGERSVVAKKLDPVKKNLISYSAALRCYYSGVTDNHPANFIELHFVKDLLPGYFWIFPMNDGTCNVGIGMRSDVVSKKKINLRKKMEDIIKNHPVISGRFTHAKAESEYSGWGLPLGSTLRNACGDNFLLTGDAGSLIDPFTGEGIGNALYSGMLAADTIEAAITKNDFGKNTLAGYQHALHSRLQPELNLSFRIQQLATKAWLFNFVVKKAANNRTLRETITSMFDDIDIRANLKKPSFYFKLMFGK
jgi:geranylgeranyl reductase family protein